MQLSVNCESPLRRLILLNVEYEKMRYFLLASVLAFTFSGFAAHAPKSPLPQEKFLQGTWRFEGSDEKKNSWFLKWTFDMGNFTLEGHPPLHQEGSYQITSVEGDRVTIELFDQKGTFGTEKSHVEVVLDKKKETLMIKGQGPFIRVKE
jgi:hypothetical protein